jgi:Mce-associated membrane protein
MSDILESTRRDAGVPHCPDDSAEVPIKITVPEEIAGSTEAQIPRDADIQTATDDIAGDSEQRSTRSARAAAYVGVGCVLTLSTLTGWLGWQAYRANHVEQRRVEFLQMGRQGALNLTTINWQQGESDVKRILESTTGPFHDDFQKRSASLIEAVTQAQSSTVGTIEEAGLESESETGAQALAAVSVQTTNAGVQDREPRHWRMRISIEKVGNVMKVSNVEFIP